MNNSPINKPLYLSIISVIVILAVGGYLSWSLASRPNFDVISPKQNDLPIGVNLSGQVVAAQDISLSFQKSGTVSELDVKEGDAVKTGQVLAKLDNKDAAANLGQASAAMQLAQANYQKTLNGATNADVAVAQTTLDNAKTNLKNTKLQQDVLVSNAAQALINSGVSAVASAGNSGNITATVTGTYTGTNQGQYKITVYATGNGLSFQYSGLENGSGQVDVTPQPIGKDGLYIQFSDRSVPTGNSWTISLPNTLSPTYIINNNNYQAALQTRQAALAQAQAQVDAAQAALTLKQTPARPEDVAASKAQLGSAGSLVQTAENNLSNGVITAPADGIITDVKPKIGESVSPGAPIISMISNEKFQMQTFVSETDLAKIKTDDTASVTLDAFGPDSSFPATVINIDSAPTIVGGISTYKTTLEFTQNDNRIREGLGASAKIVDQTKTNVLTIPSSSLFTDNGKQYVLIKSQNKISRKEIKTGLNGLDGNVEVISGLTTEDQILSF